MLNIASSDIASLLLHGGETAHSQFLMPLLLNENSWCSIKQGSLKAKLLNILAALIIWDETPKVNRFAKKERGITKISISSYDVIMW